jgi:hypothetical protein
LVKQEGRIRLDHVDNAINRIGSCTLKVFYNNKRSFKHTFEVFPFFIHEDIPICFGLDILPQLNIGITGLVRSHLEQTGSKLPQIKPNDNPYGTHTEREPGFKNLIPDALSRL